MVLLIRRNRKFELFLMGNKVTIEDTKHGYTKAVNNQRINEVLNESTSRFVEGVCKIFTHDIHIEDTNWQVVYNLKEEIIKVCEGLGLIIEDNN
jgi:hypothetical protein